MKRTFLATILLLAMVVGCKNEAPPKVATNFYDSQLFKDVQLSGIFEDSKTFVDLLPLKAPAELQAEYLQQKDKPDFDLKAFVEANFKDNSMQSLDYVTDTTETMYQHINGMWDRLTRGPDHEPEHSTRVGLPHKYIVPGGRFQEIFYWDSYFTMVGLMLDERQDLAKNMVDNFSYLIDTLGFIPNGTRDYFLTRSQPPFYSAMVNLLADGNDETLLHYFPQMLKEHEFWMKGSNDLQEDGALYQVVQVHDSIVMNRYWDTGYTPRPEAYKEDYRLASKLPDSTAKKELYNNLRAGATSGIDYSSRWYEVDDDFSSTATTHMIPVDLNSLMYFMETQIAKAYGLQGNTEKQQEFEKMAETRKHFIQTLLWDPEAQFFFDYNFKMGELTDEYTLAATYPLFFNIATPEQAKAVRDKLMADFLKDGGLLTTLKKTGQQWDAPNGWAPLEWMAVNGLLNYGYKEEAKDIMQRWLALNEKVYKNTGKMMEKYNVEDTSLLSGGGEYKTQDGFGWTNGVALGFHHLLETMK